METKFYLKKIDLNSPNNCQLKQGLDDYLNSYERYFDRSVPIMTSISENENPTEIQQEKNSFSQNRNNYYVTFSLTKPNMNRNLPLLTPSSHKKEHNFLRRNTQHVNNNKKPTEQYISVTEKDVSEIFDNFKRIKNNKPQYEITNNNNVNFKLQMQENALSRYMYHQIKNENMKSKLSKSLKRGKDTLLMHSIDDYREKNEEKLLESRIIRNKNYWYDSLRQPVEKEKLSKKTFFKNFGTYQNPKWKITSMIRLTERIRSPIRHQPISNSISEISKNNKYSFTVNNTFDVLNEESNEFEIKEENIPTKKSIQFAGLNIVGKDLLKFEEEQFNEMKNRSKKFYYCHVQNNSSEDFEILSSNQKVKDKTTK